METKRIVVPAAEEVLHRYFPVLDYGFLALVDYMGGDLSVEESARCSYQVGPGERLPSERRHLLRYMMRQNHTSPFEMCEIRVHIGLPIFVMRQWIRTRTASTNEYSGRYSDMPLVFHTPDPEYVCYQSQSNKQGSGGAVTSAEYADFLRDSNEVRYEASDAYCTSIARDIARETARIDLPLSTYTYAYWKIDLHNALRMIGNRSDSHAQRQTRDYSDVLAGIVKRVAPSSFEAFVDYHMDAVSFTRGELVALRHLSAYHASPVYWENPPQHVINSINCVLDENGVPSTPSGRQSREQGEFWAKLKGKVKRDFDLDLGLAKDGSYFLSIVNDHMIEKAAA